jgi:hypothetical protein
VFSFADDTAVVYAASSKQEVKNNCEMDLKILNDWFRYHRICPNSSKTKIVEYRYKRNNREFESYTIKWHSPECSQVNCNCREIETTDKIKYLGIVLNTNLNWSEHSLYQQTKLRRQNYLLYHIRNTVPKQVRKQVYQAFYEPILSYGIECWGGAADYILEPIRVLQKFAVRSIMEAGYRDHSKPIFKKLQLLPFEGLYQRSLALVLHRKAIRNEINYHQPKHTHRMRKPQIFQLPRKWMNKKAQRQISYRVPLYGNTLPIELVTILKQPCFRKRIKQHILTALTDETAEPN